MTFSLEQKREMRERLLSEMEASGLSNNRFATERLGFKSPSKLSHLLNNWQEAGLVGDATWETVKKFLDNRQNYRGIASNNLIKVWDVCERAYELKATIPVIGNGGFGKTYSLEKYKEKVEGEKRFKCYYYNAKDSKTRKQFVVGLMKALDCYKEGTIGSQMIMMRDHIRKQNALILIDEVSAIEGRHVTIIKDVVDMTKDLVGVVLAGTPYFIDNLNRGVSRDKHLFSETKDRLFMIPEHLQPPTEREAEAIFRANGITGEALDIVMGRVPELKKYSWTVKPTFRGIADCIIMIRMATRDNHYQLKPCEEL